MGGRLFYLPHTEFKILSPLLEIIIGKCGMGPILFICKLNYIEGIYSLGGSPATHSNKFSIVCYPYVELAGSLAISVKE